MGLRKTAAKVRRGLARLWRGPDPQGSCDHLRICRVEELEPRNLLAADVPDIKVGIFYYEADGGQDTAGDRLEVTFNGGAPGTQLKQIIIDTDKDGLGLSTGDAFFDTAAGGLGASLAFPYTVVDKTGIDTVQATVSDGGTKLRLDFTGFDVGEKFVFSIDVDEKGFSTNSSNAIVEGEEFEGSKMFAWFTAPHFFDNKTSEEDPPRFFDAFTFAGSGLNLPPDDYLPPGSDAVAPVRTAGVKDVLTPVPLPITISGTVFEDINLNNVREPASGDVGIGGVTLALLELQGNTYVSTGKTAVTNAQGDYVFNGVLPGTYRVVETQPGNYFSVGAKAGTVNGVVNGAVTTVDVISDIALLGGQDSIHNDYAEARPASLSGHVFHDADNDGVRDQGEEGIGQVKIVLERLASTTPQLANSFTEVFTDAVGFWIANGLRPGNYVVREVQPAGFFDGKDKAGSLGGTAVNPGDEINSVVVLSGQNGINYDFGELRPVSISGMVHTDTNFDCILGPGEVPLAGVTIYLLDVAGNRIANTTTKADGTYEFIGLPPGTYGVEEVQPSGFYDGGETVGSHGGSSPKNDFLTGVTIGSGQSATDYNFCEHPPATLSGRVYIDDNDNGLDDSEVGIGGVTLRLLNANGAFTGITTTTAANGTYSFTNLAPGGYGVEELQPNGFYDGKDAAGTAGGTALNPGDRITGATLAPAQVGQKYNFGELRPASISGRVIRDEDGDCELDPEEQPLSGVTIYLLDATGQRIGQTTTNADGFYFFTNLRPGVYGVEEITPPGVFDGEEHAGSAGGSVVSNDNIQGAVLGSGTNAVEYDFCENAPVTLAGRVYVDHNDNGIIDAGEPGISGVTLRLLTANGAFAGVTTTTGEGGAYVFTGLAPGVYGVEELQPNGYYDGKDAAGTAGGAAQNPGDRITGAVLDPGIHGKEYNFGELAPAVIRGRVHADTDEDCELDPGEVTLGDVTILLLDANGTTIGSTKTKSDGTYEFTNLKPGVYGVRELQPLGYFNSEAEVGTAGGSVTAVDQITGITLGSGQQGNEYDFCEHPPASISGRVHVDRDGDCVFDPGEEQPLAGVTIYLLDATGSRIEATTTDANGRYSFAGLDPSKVYGVEEIQPSGYFDSEEHIGSAGGVQLTNDKLEQIDLDPGEAAVDYNFCEVAPASISGRVHVDRDGDCEFDPGEEQPLAGVTIHLLDAEGTRIRSTTTDANGKYEFTGLKPGKSYGIEEIQPSGVFDSEEHVGSAGGMQLTNDKLGQIVLGSGEVAVDYNFCEVSPASISGMVHVDEDGDCELDPGEEQPLQGVTIFLLDAEGTRIASTKTDANGRYSFTGLEPGKSYGVEEIQPDGVYDSEDHVGSAGGVQIVNDKIQQIVLDPGEDAVDYNFCEVPPSQLCGRVYVDLNGNGVDDDEPPIANVTLMLLNSNGSPTGVTVLTDENGEYCFLGLAPGVYGVQEVQPAGYFDGLDSAGSAGGKAENPGDRITGATLTPGLSGKNYNFGERTPGTLAGYVFRDGPPIALKFGQNSSQVNVESLRSGARNPGDQPIAGVTLLLADGKGTLLRDADGNLITAVTDANGYYEFTGLTPGFYSVFELQPERFTDGIDTPGSTGGLAANKANLFAPSLVNLNHRNDAIVGISVVAGEASIENNFSEVEFDEPPFIPPPPPPPPPTTASFPSLGSSVRSGIVPPIIPPALPSYTHYYGGGVGGVGKYSWHLSVIDAGNPRGERTRAGQLVVVGESRFDVFMAASPEMGESKFLLPVEGQAEGRAIYFGMEGAIPISGDFDGDGRSEVGVFYKGQWFIDLNGNGVWDAEDLWAELGGEADFPVTGDWDGDGKTDIGIFGPSWKNDERAVAREPGLPDTDNQPTGKHKNVPPKPQDAAVGMRKLKRTAQGRMRADLVDHVFFFGTDLQTPVAGDWNGDGIATIGMFQNGLWILDDNGDGQWLPGETIAEFGQPGDIPVVGDFNGDGIDELAVYRGGIWYIDINNNRKQDAEDLVIEHGTANDRPVVGDWNGDGRDEVGLYSDGAGLKEKS